MSDSPSDSFSEDSESDSDSWSDEDDEEEVSDSDPDSDSSSDSEDEEDMAPNIPTSEKLQSSQSIQDPNISKCSTDPDRNIDNKIQDLNKQYLKDNNLPLKAMEEKLTEKNFGAKFPTAPIGSEQPTNQLPSEIAIAPSSSPNKQSNNELVNAKDLKKSEVKEPNSKMTVPLEPNKPFLFSGIINTNKEIEKSEKDFPMMANKTIKIASPTSEKLQKACSKPEPALCHKLLKTDPIQSQQPLGPSLGVPVMALEAKHDLKNIPKNVGISDAIKICSEPNKPVAKPLPNISQAQQEQTKIVDSNFASKTEHDVKKSFNDSEKFAGISKSPDSIAPLRPKGAESGVEKLNYLPPLPKTQIQPSLHSPEQHQHLTNSTFAGIVEEKTICVAKTGEYANDPDSESHSDSDSNSDSDSENEDEMPPKYNLQESNMLENSSSNQATADQFQNSLKSQESQDQELEDELQKSSDAKTLDKNVDSELSATQHVEAGKQSDQQPLPPSLTSSPPANKIDTNILLNKNLLKDSSSIKPIANLPESSSLPKVSDKKLGKLGKIVEGDKKIVAKNAIITSTGKTIDKPDHQILPSQKLDSKLTSTAVADSKQHAIVNEQHLHQQHEQQAIVGQPVSLKMVKQESERLKQSGKSYDTVDVQSLSEKTKNTNGKLLKYEISGSRIGAIVFNEEKYETKHCPQTETASNALKIISATDNLAKLETLEPKIDTKIVNKDQLNAIPANAPKIPKGDSNVTNLDKPDPKIGAIVFYEEKLKTKFNQQSTIPSNEQKVATSDKIAKLEKHETNQTSASVSGPNAVPKIETEKMHKLNVSPKDLKSTSEDLSQMSDLPNAAPCTKLFEDQNEGSTSNQKLSENKVEHTLAQAATVPASTRSGMDNKRLIIIDEIDGKNAKELKSFTQTSSDNAKQRASDLTSEKFPNTPETIQMQLESKKSPTVKTNPFGKTETTVNKTVIEKEKVVSDSLLELELITSQNAPKSPNKVVEDVADDFQAPSNQQTALSKEVFATGVVNEEMERVKIESTKPMTTPCVTQHFALQKDVPPGIDNDLKLKATRMPPTGDDHATSDVSSIKRQADIGASGSAPSKPSVLDEPGNDVLAAQDPASKIDSRPEERNASMEPSLSSKDTGKNSARVKKRSKKRQKKNKDSDKKHSRKKSRSKQSRKKGSKKRRKSKKGSKSDSRKRDVDSRNESKSDSKSTKLTRSKSDHSTSESRKMLKKVASEKGMTDAKSKTVRSTAEIAEIKSNKEPHSKNIVKNLFKQQVSGTDKLEKSVKISEKNKLLPKEETISNLSKETKKLHSKSEILSATVENSSDKKDTENKLKEKEVSINTSKSKKRSSKRKSKSKKSRKNPSVKHVPKIGEEQVSLKSSKDSVQDAKVSSSQKSNIVNSNRQNREPQSGENIEPKPKQKRAKTISKSKKSRRKRSGKHDSDKSDKIAGKHDSEKGNKSSVKQDSERVKKSSSKHNSKKGKTISGKQVSEKENKSSEKPDSEKSKKNSKRQESEKDNKSSGKPNSEKGKKSHEKQELEKGNTSLGKQVSSKGKTDSSINRSKRNTDLPKEIQKSPSKSEIVSSRSSKNSKNVNSEKSVSEKQVSENSRERKQRKKSVGKKSNSKKSKRAKKSKQRKKSSKK